MITVWTLWMFIIQFHTLVPHEMPTQFSTKADCEQAALAVSYYSGFVVGKYGHPGFRDQPDLECKEKKVRRK